MDSRRVKRAQSVAIEGSYNTRNNNKEAHSHSVHEPLVRSLSAEAPGVRHDISGQNEAKGGQNSSTAVNQINKKDMKTMERNVDGHKKSDSKPFELRRKAHYWAALSVSANEFSGPPGFGDVLDRALGAGAFRFATMYTMTQAGIAVFSMLIVWNFYVAADLAAPAAVLAALLVCAAGLHAVSSAHAGSMEHFNARKSALEGPAALGTSSLSSAAAAAAGAWTATRKDLKPFRHVHRISLPLPVLSALFMLPLLPRLIISWTGPSEAILFDKIDHGGVALSAANLQVVQVLAVAISLCLSACADRAGALAGAMGIMVALCLGLLPVRLFDSPVWTIQCIAAPFALGVLTLFIRGSRTRNSELALMVVRSFLLQFERHLVAGVDGLDVVHETDDVPQTRRRSLQRASESFHTPAERIMKICERLGQSDAFSDFSSDLDFIVQSVSSGQDLFRPDIRQIITDVDLRSGAASGCDERQRTTGGRTDDSCRATARVDYGGALSVNLKSATGIDTAYDWLLYHSGGSGLARRPLISLRASFDQHHGHSHPRLPFEDASVSVLVSSELMKSVNAAAALMPPHADAKYHVHSVDATIAELEEMLGPSNVARWDFPVFKLKWQTHTRPLYFVGLALARKIDILAQLNIPVLTFSNWLDLVELGYNGGNPYHNSAHGADVALSFFWLIEQADVLKVLSPHEQFACLIAALVHDYEHPGVNNAFLVATSDAVAITHNDRSVLENHHLSAMFRLCTSHEDADVFAPLRASSAYMETRSLIIELVLATDFAKHFEALAQFTARARGRKNIDDWSFSSEQGDRVLMLKLLLKCADIGHTAKNSDLHQRWTEAITREFYNQGDREKALNLPLSPFMDSSKPEDLPKSQCGFISFLVLPLFREVCSVFPKVSPALDQLERNLKRWKRLDHEVESAST